MNRNPRTNLVHTTLRAARGIATLALLSLLSAGTAAAGDWRFSITPYAWATNIGVSTKLDGRQIVDKEISVSDLLEDLDTIVQVRVDAMHGAHGIALDLFDVTLSDEANDVALPQGAGQADLKSDIGMTILDLTGVFDPKGDRRGLAFVYGTRIINERATIDGTFVTSPSTTVEQSYDTHETLVDALAGIRFTQFFSRHWSCQARADVSTGGTDYTWSVGPSVSYAFGNMGRFGLNAGYRLMTVDFEDENGMDTEMTLSGLLIGLRTSF